jgi:CCR4-NOT transcriptional regulation complex NOT5 subunit
VQVTQQKELVKQLHAKLNLTEGRVVDLKAFQTLSLEAHTKIEAKQQKLISKIEIIQNYFQEVRKSLDNIILQEKEAKETRNTFQKAVACSGNREMLRNLNLSVIEQIRGDIMLKVWETNISENKKIVK